MNVLATVLLVLLAAVFLIAGLRKFVRPDPELRHATGRSGYAVIGILELAAAAGLVLPTVTGIAVWLVPVTAVCLALLMAGAFVVNRRMRRPRDIPVTVVLAVLAVALAVLRLPAPGWA